MKDYKKQNDIIRLSEDEKDDLIESLTRSLRGKLYHNIEDITYTKFITKDIQNDNILSNTCKYELCRLFQDIPLEINGAIRNLDIINFIKYIRNNKLLNLIFKDYEFCIWDIFLRILKSMITMLEDDYYIKLQQDIIMRGKLNKYKYIGFLLDMGQYDGKTMAQIYKRSQKAIRNKISRIKEDMFKLGIIDYLNIKDNDKNMARKIVNFYYNDNFHTPERELKKYTQPNSLDLLPKENLTKDDVIDEVIVRQHFSKEYPIFEQFNTLWPELIEHKGTKNI